MLIEQQLALAQLSRIVASTPQRPERHPDLLATDIPSWPPGTPASHPFHRVEQGRSK
ncbi:hypothetical protein [Pseudomonas sp. YJ42]|uniref:hypothetical protein n=1 Tax=Pseudomonas sp. YJ42 TaxID=3392115 RepID=UPI00399FDA7B